MRNPTIRSILLATTFALAGCGGGGGSGVAPLPPPPPTPTPTPTPAGAPAIIPAATTSQQFAAIGASHMVFGDQPGLESGSQLQVRYVASSKSYEVQVPTSQTWVPISYVSTGAGNPINFMGDNVALWLRSDGYQYSRLFEWSGNAFFGYEAIGMATPASGIPTNGSASYTGQILGSTPEVHEGDDMGIQGSIALNFDFGSGNLSGSISPVLRQDFATIPLDTVDFRDTVYAAGSTTFSGAFDTNLSGRNSFSGLFTGPNAQEVIGNFALPYQSPNDGQTYQSDGAFIGKK